MSTPVGLLAFAAALAAVFVLALVGARTLLPADLATIVPTNSSTPTEQRSTVGVGHP